MKILIIIVSFLFLLNTNLWAQDEMHTKDKENGYLWVSLKTNYNSSIYHPKYNFLILMLNRYETLRIKNNEDYFIDCRDELTRLKSESKAEPITIDIIIKKIDEFYTIKENLFIPIEDAYCYCIKEIAGAGKDELSKYKNELMERYKD